jgi:hypothetical protein
MVKRKDVQKETSIVAVWLTHTAHSVQNVSTLLKLVAQYLNQAVPLSSR